MKDKVDAFAALCNPDFRCVAEYENKIVFDLISGKVGLRFHSTEKEAVFNDWSRAQLLSHFGVREKWFSFVSQLVEAEEFNKRIHALEDHRFRTMKDPKNDVDIVRAFVSESYADIPDTSVMEALTKTCPDASLLSHYTDKTDKALYVYMLAERNPIELGGCKGLPGLVVKNSEVGYTSLWVIPFLYVEGSLAIFVKRALLRRVHRGSVSDLVNSFDEAIGKAGALWGDLEQKLSGLTSIRYSSEDDAVEHMRAILERAGTSAGFIRGCEQLYRATQHSHHRGIDIFESVLERVSLEKDKDEAHLSAAVAGAVLLLLVK